MYEFQKQGYKQLEVKESFFFFFFLGIYLPQDT